MNEEKKRKDKIKPFPTSKELAQQEEWNQRFKERLIKDADAWEKELENAPNLSHIETPPYLFDSIVYELKKKGIWEKEEAEELSPDVYALLSEKDRKALEIGREIQKKELEERAADEEEKLRTASEVQYKTEEKRKRKAARGGRKRKVGKWIGTAAAVCVCVLAASLSSEANRNYVMGVVNTVTGWGVETRISKTENVREYVSEEETIARAELEKELGVRVPQLQYRTKEVEYSEYHVNPILGSGCIVYEYQGVSLLLYIYTQGKEYVYNQVWDGEVVDRERIEATEEEVEIRENKGNEGNWRSYTTLIQGEDVQYLLISQMELEAFKNIIRDLVY